MSGENNDIKKIREEEICTDKTENIFSDKQFECECQCKCEKSLPFKKNCNGKYCTLINEENCNIKNAECAPILSKKIFDCISLEEKQFSFLEDVVFTIEGDTREFDPKESICIDKIGIAYKFIGLKTNSNSVVLVDSKSYVFHIPREKIFSGCNSHLYNENNMVITTGKYSCNEIDNENAGIKTRIIEKDLNFLVCGLKIFVKGRIGLREFTAVKDYTEEEIDCNCKISLIVPPPFPISIKKLGFSPITFVGRVCLPQGAKKSIIHQKFDNLLCVECVIPKNNNVFNQCLLFCEDKAMFRADVELSLLSKKFIYSTIREKLDEVIDENDNKCWEYSLESSCECKLEKN